MNQINTFCHSLHLLLIRSFKPYLLITLEHGVTGPAHVTCRIPNLLEDTALQKYDVNVM